VISVVLIPYNAVRFSSNGHIRAATAIPSSPQYPWGERLALIEDLALAKATHAELAEKYGKSVQAIHQFSQRNAGEIATRRQTLLAGVDAEAAHLLDIGQGDAAGVAPEDDRGYGSGFGRS
jgi:hypothetical protein